MSVAFEVGKIRFTHNVFIMRSYPSVRSVRQKFHRKLNRLAGLHQHDEAVHSLRLAFLVDSWVVHVHEYKCVPFGVLALLIGLVERHNVVFGLHAYLKNWPSILDPIRPSIVVHQHVSVVHFCQQSLENDVRFPQPVPCPFAPTQYFSVRDLKRHRYIGQIEGFGVIHFGHVDRFIHCSYF